MAAALRAETMLYRKSKSRDDHTVIPALKLFLIILPGHLGCIGGQVVHDEPEDGAFAQRALHTEAEAVLLEDGLGDGKPQAGALLARIGAGAVIPASLGSP